MKSPAFSGTHRRFNPLTGQWVLVSVGRTARPWQGDVETVAATRPPSHDPDCYLCPGNTRAGGAVNPHYENTLVFTNDFPALRPDVRPEHSLTSPLFRAETVPGTCRVVCFSPRHDLTLALMDAVSIRDVIDVWAQQTKELGELYRWVQVFENSGSAMGASSPHPHGQIWAGSALPHEIELEDRHQQKYYGELGTCLLLDYLEQEEQEEEDGRRIVVSGASWVAVVPYWAVWPFETLILPRRHIQRLPDLAEKERDDLAQVLRELLIRYDNLFQTPFPYSMGWHGAPFDSGGGEHWQLHAHVYPPLLRSPSIRKSMVGYEMLAEPQRDLSAEEAASHLRALPTTHYLSRSTDHVD